MRSRGDLYDVPDELPADEPDRLLSRAEASAYLATLGIAIRPQTLAALASRGAHSPKIIKVGRRVLYAKRDVHAWGAAKLVGYRAATRHPR